MTTQLIQILGLTLGAAALFGALAYWTTRRQAARHAALRALATQWGWDYDPGGPDFVWRMRSRAPSPGATLLAVAPVSQHQLNQGGPRYTRCELLTDPSVQLLIEPVGVADGVPALLNPIPQMVGASYGMLVTLPVVQAPPELAGQFALRAPDDATVSRALTRDAVAALTHGGRAGSPERPWVTIADGRVRVTIPGRALWAPAEVEALLRLCEALAASTRPTEGRASGVGRPEGG